MRYSKQLYQEWAEAHVRNVDYFVIRLFLGRGKYDVRQAATLKEARQIKHQMVTEWGKEAYGRKPVIYAVTKGLPLTIHVE